jgi:HK97 family phage major capsid protein
MDKDLQAALDALGMTQKQAVEAQQKAHKEFTETVTADSAKRDAVYDAKIEKLQTALDKFEPVSAAIAKVEAQAKADAEAKAAADAALIERLDQFEVELKRPRAVEGDESKAKAKLDHDAFFEFARRGDRMDRERMNVLTIADDTTGGYLAPAEYVMDILKNVIEFSPIRGLATVRTTSQKSVQYPKRTGVFAANWVGEIETRTETTGLTYGLEDIPVHEMTAESYITMANLEDSAFNLEQILKEEFTEQFGVAEGIAFITGNGVKKPQGFTVASGTNSVNSGAATSVTADGLIDLKYSVKTQYTKNGTYVLNRGTLKVVRKLKDGNGQYLWVPGLAVGRPNAIDGDPYVECPDMADLAASSKSVAYGDFKRGMIVVDRLTMSLLRDAYTRASVGQIKFVARRRLGAQVVIPEAISVLTTST